MTLHSRPFGRSGWTVSEIGFGAWPISGSWGRDETQGRDALLAALEAGTTFIDTADMYGDYRPERIVGEVLKEWRGARPVIATKGRVLHTGIGYTQAALQSFIDRSRRNLGMDTLDLVQMHCPPSEAYDDPEVFEVMDAFVASGKIRSYGVCVATVEDALKAIEYPGVVSVRIIYNIFQQRAAEHFFNAAKARNVAVIASVPVQSELLTDKLDPTPEFRPDDHVEVGKTFSGVPGEVALEAIDAIRALVPAGTSMAAFALRWILMADAVSVVIPGAKSRAQVQTNAAASALGPLSAETMHALKKIYEDKIAPHVHHRR